MVSNASKYEIMVYANEERPFIRTKTDSAVYYQSSEGGYILSQADQWVWKVRAQIGYEWSAWSKVGYYTVEPVDSDPPWQDGIE